MNTILVDGIKVFIALLLLVLMIKTAYYFKEKDHERKENVCSVQSTTTAGDRNKQTFIHYWG